MQSRENGRSDGVGRRIHGRPGKVRQGRPRIAASGLVAALFSSRKRRPNRIVLGVTDPISIRLIEGHPAHLASQGWEVTLVTGGQSPVVEGAESAIIRMRRDPSPRADALALLRWILFLRRLRPSSIMVGTPKAGLLGIVAGWLTRVPHRTYLLRGLRLEGTTGLLRSLLSALEQVTCSLATDVIAISPSLADKVVELRLAQSTKVRVLGSGSSNGVDLLHYRPPTRQQANGVRARLGIRADTFVVGFVGRLHRDKGIDTLLTAFERLDSPVDIVLLIAGQAEGVALPEHAGGEGTGIRVIALGHVADVREVYTCIDLLCLPSRREGFGNVVIEAAAMGVPAIVSDATGCRDTVVPGSTGWLVPVGDAQALALAIDEARNSPLRTRERGSAARIRVEQKFDRNVLWSLYDEHLGRHI